jgi:hypothetical protein
MNRLARSPAVFLPDVTSARRLIDQQAKISRSAEPPSSDQCWVEGEGYREISAYSTDLPEFARVDFWKRRRSESQKRSRWK